MKISPSAHASRPQPFTGPIPLVDTPRYDSNIDQTYWADREVATVRYEQGGTQVSVSARVGDSNHVGNRFQGTFAEALGRARVEASLDDIDMPELGAAAVLRGAHEGEWIVAPINGYLPGGHYGDENGPATNLPIDPKNGSTYGPERVWESTGSSRPGRWFPDGVDDAISTAVRVSASKVDPSLVAIVGVDRWIDLGSHAR